MKTTLAKAETTTHDWKIVDATDQILGRLAVQIANALRGRNKPTYTPHVDTGDFVIVTNADKIKLTGANSYFKSCLSLPLYPDLKKSQVNYICKKIKLIISKYKKY